jgi:hypothetical protein
MKLSFLQLDSAPPPLPIIIPIFPHARISPLPLEVYGSPGQAAHYHILRGLISDPELRCLQSKEVGYFSILRKINFQ